MHYYSRPNQNFKLRPVLLTSFSRYSRFEKSLISHEVRRALLDTASPLDVQQSVFSWLVFFSDWANKVERGKSGVQAEQKLALSVVDHLLDGLQALPLVWDVERLKDVREGGVVTTHSEDWGLQV